MGMAHVTTLAEELNLKPCPFCGSVSLDIQPVQDLGVQRGAHIWQMARVYCNACSAGGAQRDSEQEAVEAWNTRIYG